MAETHWTPSLVEERLAEAASVLKRLPEPKLQGYYNLWPRIIYEFGDLVGQEPSPLRVLPSPAAISRMEETLDWLKWLEPIDRKVVWLRASGERWKTVCWKVGLQRAAAHEHWLYALCLIAWRLNGSRLAALRSKRHLIEHVRGRAQQGGGFRQAPS